MKNFNYISMFSGIGGFELGIEKATKKRWKCVGYSEIDKYATEIYEKHFPEHRNYNNAREIKAKDLPDFDAIVGGFPCQAFSIAGKRKGFADVRGTLFYEIARIVAAKRPTVLLLENVKGLLNHDNGSTFARILKTIWDLGYNAEWCVLNSKNYGVPQNRERVFIVGCLREKCPKELFFKRESSELSNKKNQRKQGKGEGICSTIDARYGALRNLVQVHNMQPRSPDRPSLTKLCPCGSGKLYQKCCGVSSGTGHLQRDDTAYCLDSHQSNAVELRNRTIRRLTPIECERLQGFPDDWTKGISDTQRYKCLGNAVTVNVIEAVFKRLEEWLN